MRTVFRMHQAGHIPSSRPIEFWLTVFPAAGIFVAGWGCVLLRAINRMCHDVAQPETRAAWLSNAARGQTPQMHQIVAWWLWSTFNAGAWPEEILSLSACIEAGTFIGVTLGFIAYLAIG